MSNEITADLFEGVKDAKITTLPDKPKEGRYIVRLDEVRLKKTSSQGGKKMVKTFIAINYTVLSAIQTVEGSEAHRVGDTCAYTIWRDGSEYAPAYFQRDLKQFITGINPDEDFESLNEQEFVAGCMDMVGDGQPLKGWVVEMRNWGSYSKNDLNDDGEPRPGAKRYVNTEWQPKLDAERIQAEVDEAVIKRFEVLTD